MAVVNKFNVNNKQVTLDADIIENMSANDVSYNSSLQYDENTVGDKLSELEKKIVPFYLEQEITFTASNKTKICFDNLNLKGGEYFLKFRIESNDAVWSRLALYANNDWSAVDKWDYLNNNTEYIKANVNDIQSLWLYLITAQQVGTIKVTLKIYSKITTDKLANNTVTLDKLEDSFKRKISNLDEIYYYKGSFMQSKDREVISGINIPSGTKLRIRVLSDDAVWTRLSIFGNTSDWNKTDYKLDYLETNTDIVWTTPVNITNVRLYPITVSQWGTFELIIEPFMTITTEKLANESVTTEKLANESVTDKKTNFFEFLNLVDPDTLHVGTYGNGWNIFTPNSLYTCTSAIQVKPNTTYYIKAFTSPSNEVIGARFVQLYNSNQKQLRALTKTNSFTTNDDEVYVFITYYSTASDYFLGTTLPTTFKSFGGKIPGSLIDADSLVVGTNSISNGAVTQEKLSEGVHIDTSPIQFGALVKSEDVIGANISINPPFIHCYKNILIVGEVKSTFEKVAMGLSYMGYYGWWIEITSTDISAHSGSSGTIIWTEPHELTLTTNTIVIISIDNPNGSQFVKIINNEGDIYEKNISFSGQGEPFLKNLNVSSSISAVIKFFPRDIIKKIWMFGDSYFTTGSPTRWPYYLFQSGYESFLMSSQGGDSATQAIQSFNNLLTTGIKPSFALWYIGMNGGRDASDGPNANWLNITNQFLATCDEYGITPVLATIPTCPNEIHIKMNAWIKASGRRYIDCAKMVESETEGNYYWKGWGTDKAMLSSDEVHPTTQGAKALFTGTMIDFPEIAVND